MGTILLTGIPGVGKTGLVEVTRDISRRSYEKDLTSISLADLVARNASRFWKTSRKKVYNLDLEYQRQLRHAAILEAAFKMAKASSDQHVVVDTPMSMFVRDGYIPNVIFSADDIALLHEARPLDYIVTLLEDPNMVSGRLKDTPYPKSVGEVLNWMAMEVDVTRSFFNQDALNSGLEEDKPYRHLVIPRAHSDQTLAKLLNDPKAPVVYLAGPITHLRPKVGDSRKVLKEKQEAKKRMREFQHRLQEYAVVVAPMELADTGVSPEEIRHTVNRDLHWFVANADVTIAFFPGDYKSSGTVEEMNATIRAGKSLFLIHPTQNKEVFGVSPTLHFRTGEEFFATLEKATRNDDPNLRSFIDSSQYCPRYARLQPHAVAIDIYESRTNKHLLIQQGSGKSFAGKWMLVAGKKDNMLDLDIRTIQRELFEEIAMWVHQIEQGYRIYKVDYAVPNLEGTSPRYVRIYRAAASAVQGRPQPNHATSKDEVAGVKWFTPEQVLSMGEKKVVPVTLQYFKDISKQ